MAELVTDKTRRSMYLDLATQWQQQPSPRSWQNLGSLALNREGLARSQKAVSTGTLWFGDYRYVLSGRAAAARRLVIRTLPQC
jgi:hypothetical protein